jgi:hypothetical protein
MLLSGAQRNPVFDMHNDKFPLCQLCSRTLKTGFRIRSHAQGNPIFDLCNDKNFHFANYVLGS